MKSLTSYLAQRAEVTLGFGLALVVLAAPLTAQNADPEPEEMTPINTEAYLAPSQEIMDAVLAPRWEDVSLRNLDPSGRYFLHSVSDGFPTLASFAKKHYDLGQFQVDPIARRDRRLTTRSDVGYDVISVDTWERTPIEVPEGARVTGASWSPDGSQLAFFAHFEDGTHIYVADTDDGDSRQISRDYVLPTMVTNLSWTQDGESIVAVARPEDMGPEPAEPAVPETPMVRVTTDEENRLRTYFDLLENPYEKRLVEYFATGQLAIFEVDSRDIRRIGEPAMIEGFDVSPDGRHFIVEQMKQPFSYIVPTSSAGSVEELWDIDGNVLATLDESELSEGAGRGGRGGGDGGGDEKRGLTWRVDGQPGMAFLQMEPRPRGQQDEEPEEEEAEEEETEPRMDRVMYWLPPFDSTSTQVVYESEDRIAGFDFDDTGRVLFLTRTSGGNGGGRGGFGGGGSRTTTAVFLDEGPSEEFEIVTREGDDITEDPGSVMNMQGSFGEGVVRTTRDGSSVFLQGTQYFEDPLENAPRPFIDRVEIRTGAKSRVFQSAEDMYETVVAELDRDLSRVIVQRESPTTVPNAWLVETATGQLEQVTDNPDHTPQLTAARRELFTITRPDGFESRVTVTLPADYREGTALPGMFWFYPREYTEQEDYDEGFERYNKNDFPGIGSRSMEILTLQGYAVIEPDLPIVGDDGQMNNNYVRDLVNTLLPVIDTVAARGWVDRDRLGIGGHSYGAFGTANAMVNTPYFKAGIAGDGNYNRSLTPAGFQSERRMLWEAPDVYVEMSPFFEADRLTGALLMYHGMDDHNVGTHPDHSRRLFHALNVLGKKASLYMYPYEDHGPATLETTLDLWARWTAWLDEYVKNHGRADRMTTDEDGAGGTS